jgi:peptidoglycan hydrolase-like protein with peptidoglycan-binding domain
MTSRQDESQESTERASSRSATPRFGLEKGHYYSVPFTSRSAHSGAVEDQAAIRAIQEAVGAEVTGTFSADTEAKVKAAQKKAKIAESGVVDADTWKALFR